MSLTLGEIPQVVISGLLNTDVDRINDTIDTFFAPDAELINPMFRLSGREEIRKLYTGWAAANCIHGFESIQIKSTFLRSGRVDAMTKIPIGDPRGIFVASGANRQQSARTQNVPSSPARTSSPRSTGPGGVASRGFDGVSAPHSVISAGSDIITSPLVALEEEIELMVEVIYRPHPFFYPKGRDVRVIVLLKLQKDKPWKGNGEVIELPEVSENGEIPAGTLQQEMKRGGGKGMGRIPLSHASQQAGHQQQPRYRIVCQEDFYATSNILSMFFPSWPQGLVTWGLDSLLRVSGWTLAYGISPLMYYLIYTAHSVTKDVKDSLIPSYKH